MLQSNISLLTPVTGPNVLFDSEVIISSVKRLLIASSRQVCKTIQSYDAYSAKMLQEITTLLQPLQACDEHQYKHITHHIKTCVLTQMLWSAEEKLLLQNILKQYSDLSIVALLQWSAMSLLQKRVPEYSLKLLKSRQFGVDLALFLQVIEAGGTEIEIMQDSRYEYRLSFVDYGLSNLAQFDRSELGEVLGYRDQGLLGLKSYVSTRVQAALRHGLQQLVDQGIEVHQLDLIRQQITTLGVALTATDGHTSTDAWLSLRQEIHSVVQSVKDVTKTWRGAEQRLVDTLNSWINKFQGDHISSLLNDAIQQMITKVKVIDIAGLCELQLTRCEQSLEALQLEARDLQDQFAKKLSSKWGVSCPKRKDFLQGLTQLLNATAHSDTDLQTLVQAAIKSRLLVESFFTNSSWQRGHYQLLADCLNPCLMHYHMSGVSVSYPLERFVGDLKANLLDYYDVRVRERQQQASVIATRCIQQVLESQQQIMLTKDCAVGSRDESYSAARARLQAMSTQNILDRASAHINECLVAIDDLELLADDEQRLAIDLVLKTLSWHLDTDDKMSLGHRARVELKKHVSLALRQRQRDYHCVAKETIRSAENCKSQYSIEYYQQVFSVLQEAETLAALYQDIQSSLVTIEAAIAQHSDLRQQIHKDISAISSFDNPYDDSSLQHIAILLSEHEKILLDYRCKLLSLQRDVQEKSTKLQWVAEQRATLEGFKQRRLVLQDAMSALPSLEQVPTADKPPCVVKKFALWYQKLQHLVKDQQAYFQSDELLALYMLLEPSLGQDLSRSLQIEQLALNRFVVDAKHYRDRFK